MLHIRLLNAQQRQQAAELLHQELGDGVHLEADSAALSVQIQNPAQATAALAKLPLAGIELSSYSLGQPSLDEVFLALTGHDTQSQDPAEQQANQL